MTAPVPEVGDGGPETRAMIEACAAAGVSLMMAYPLHFSTAFARLRAVVEAGTLGS